MSLTPSCFGWLFVDVVVVEAQKGTLRGSGHAICRLPLEDDVASCEEEAEVWRGWCFRGSTEGEEARMGEEEEMLA